MPPSGFPERASPLSQRHLARFGERFRRSGVPIMALCRLEVTRPEEGDAFPGGKGSITVSVQSAFPDVNTMTMTSATTARGFKVQAESKRHGLGLVRRLVEQVRAMASLDSENGTVWTINIPVPSSALPGAILPDTTGVGQEAA
jgi:hypothetical protein